MGSMHILRFASRLQALELLALTTNATCTISHAAVHLERLRWYSSVLILHGPSELCRREESFDATDSTMFKYTGVALESFPVICWLFFADIAG